MSRKGKSHEDAVLLGHSRWQVLVQVFFDPARIMDVREFQQGNHLFLDFGEEFNILDFAVLAEHKPHCVCLYVRTQTSNVKICALRIWRRWHWIFASWHTSRHSEACVFPSNLVSVPALIFVSSMVATAPATPITSTIALALPSTLLKSTVATTPVLATPITSIALARTLQKDSSKWRWLLGFLRIFTFSAFLLSSCGPDAPLLVTVILVGLSSCHIEIFFQRFPFTISGFIIKQERDCACDLAFVVS